jgi:hypothetical protein
MHEWFAAGEIEVGGIVFEHSCRGRSAELHFETSADAVAIGNGAFESEPQPSMVGGVVVAVED